MEGGDTHYFDKVDSKFALSTRRTSNAADFRVVPPAVARRGAFIAKNVVLMPSYVNIGAYVDEGTMVDTWATVGSCAQIGKNVHLSGGVGIGGVLEPLQANPTIIEDNCFIGARSEVVEGVIVEENSVHLDGRVHRPEHQDLRPRDRRGPLRPRARRARWWCPAPCPRRTAGTACTARSSSSRWTPRPAPRPASTSCCAAISSELGTAQEGRTCPSMKRLFQLMAEKKASDIFLSAGAPINIKINGTPCRSTRRCMDAEPIKKLLYEVLTEQQIRNSRTTLELNFALRAARASATSASTSSARRARRPWWCATSRATSRRSTPWACRDVLKEVIMEKRGLVLMVGATGSGKSTTLAAMLDYRNEQKSGHILTLEDPVEFIFTEQEIASSTSARSAPTRKASRSR